MELNKDDLRIWVKALRSGDYPQSGGCLQNEFGYCCLGVGCRLFIPADKLNLRSDGLTLSGGYPSNQTHAPEWLKSINENMLTRYGKSFVFLNDNERLSFAQIADIIEQVYLNDDNTTTSNS